VQPWQAVPRESSHLAAEVAHRCLLLPGSAEGQLVAGVHGCRLLQGGHQIRLLSCIVLPPHEEGAFVSDPISLPFSLFGVTFQP